MMLIFWELGWMMAWAGVNSWKILKESYLSYIFILRQLWLLKNIPLLKTPYNCLIESHISYSLIVLWGAEEYSLERILKWQKKPYKLYFSTSLTKPPYDSQTTIQNFRFIHLKIQTTIIITYIPDSKMVFRTKQISYF